MATRTSATPTSSPSTRDVPSTSRRFGSTGTRRRRHRSTRAAARSPTRTAASPLLEGRLDEAFGRYLDIDWPADGHDRVSSVTVDVDPGGAVTVDELAGVKLDATNRRYVYRSDRAPLDLPALTFRATPAQDYVFAGWSGCDAVLPDGACRMVPDDQERTVSPLFAFEDVRRTDVDVLDLAELKDTHVLGKPGEGGRLVLDAPVGSPDEARLSAVAEGAVLLVARPLLGTARVDGVIAREIDAGLARFTFAVTETSPLAAFQHMTAVDEERPTTLDDVTVVEVGDAPSADPQPLRAGKSKTGAAPKHRAALVHFQGLGRAFDLGQGLFLTQLPGSQQMIVVSAHGDAEALESAKLDAAGYARCSERPGQPGCAEVRADIFSPTPCKILKGKNCILPTLVVKKKAGKLTLTFSIEGAVDVTVGGNVSFALPAYMELNTRGDLTFTLAAELFAGLMSSTEAYKTCRRAANAKEVAPLPKPRDAASDPDQAFDDSLWEAPPEQLLAACDRERPGLSEDAQAKREAEKQVLREVTLQINKASPEGAAFPISVGFKIGVEAKGRLGARVVAIFRPRVRWDYSMQFGLKCSWSSLLPSCDGFSNFSGNQKFTSSHKLEAAVTANASIEPYASVGIYAGLRGVQEDMLAIEARVGLPWKLVGTGPSLRYSTLSEDVNLGQGGWCFGGNVGLATGLSAEFSVGAKLQLAIDKELGFGAKVKWNHDWTLFGWQHEEPIVKDLVLVKNVGAGATCAPPGTLDTANLPNEVTFLPGHDWADPPNSRQTKTHELVLQKDGNFVLYKVESRDKKGLVDKDRALWATQQNGRATYVLFQEDGNLVQYDIRRNPLWASGTSGAKDAKLVLQSNGDLVLSGTRDGKTGVLWSTRTGGK